MCYQESTRKLWKRWTNSSKIPSMMPKRLWKRWTSSSKIPAARTRMEMKKRRQNNPFLRGSTVNGTVNPLTLCRVRRPKVRGEVDVEASQYMHEPEEYA